MRRLSLLALLLAGPASAQNVDSAPPPAITFEADRDRRVNDALRIAREAQAYLRRPRRDGGGGGRFDGFSLRSLHYPVDADGRYVSPYSTAGETCTFRATVRRDGAAVITAASDRYSGLVQVIVSGPREDDVTVVLTE